MLGLIALEVEELGIAFEVRKEGGKEGRREGRKKTEENVEEENLDIWFSVQFTR
jgi:hypothetical protein